MADGPESRGRPESWRCRGFSHQFPVHTETLARRVPPGEPPHFRAASRGEGVAQRGIEQHGEDLGREILDVPELDAQDVPDHLETPAERETITGFPVGGASSAVSPKGSETEGIT